MYSPTIGTVIVNTEPAITALLKKLTGERSAFVICEASGGYERQVLLCCVALDLPVHRAHGSRTRSFAKYLGLSAKTDAIDARMLAPFGSRPARKPSNCALGVGVTTSPK